MILMDTSALISVIVPVYKVEEYLDRCIQSITGQTYTSLEIILVDDGSPDNCPEMCDDWAYKDNRIKVIHKENGGLSSARNAGMAEANGEYISFVDSDDWIAPKMLEFLVEAIQRDGSDVAACAVEMVTEDGTPISMLTVRRNALLDRKAAQKALLKENLLKQPVWYKLYKKSMIFDIPFEPGKYHEDVFWSYQAIGRANLVSLIDYVGYYYTQRSGSIMGKGYSITCLDALEAVENRYPYIKRESPELESEARLSIVLSCIYHGQMALKYLPAAERRTAFKYLENTIKKYPVNRQDYSDKKFTHRLWIDIARISLPMACQIGRAHV